MLRTLVESISPQTVNSRRELIGLSTVAKGHQFPGYFQWQRKSCSNICEEGVASRSRQEGGFASRSKQEEGGC